MKIQIRMGCFESNSSSMHSVVTSKTTGIYTPEEFHSGIWVHNGEWHLYSSELEFGRSPYSILCTFAEKVEYAIASLCGVYIKDEVREKYLTEIERIVCKYIPDCKEITFDTRYESKYVRETDDKEFTWLTEKEWADEPHGEFDIIGKVYGDDNTYYFAGYEYEYDNTGDVDHQSAGLLYNFLESHNLSLEEFLTHREYWVVIDGDEYCEFEKQYKHQIINVNNIAEVYPKFLTGNESERELIENYKARETAPEITEEDSYFQTPFEIGIEDIEDIEDGEVNEDEE